MSLFSAVSGKVKSRMDGLRQRFNKKAVVPVPAVKEKLIKLPYTSTTEVKTVEFKSSAAQLETIFDYRECKSHEKMNRTRAHRLAMKKHVKHAKKMNRQYGQRS